jgi:hypothetical protein
MKIYKEISIFTLFLACLILSLSSSCTSINHATPSATMYWDENASGTIETNDINRLQTKVPFTMLLPEYLPEGAKSYKLVMTLHKIDEILNLRIEYYSLTSAKNIIINEGPPQDQYPRPLPPGFLAMLTPDYTPIELGGHEVLENIGFGEVIRSSKTSQVSACLYYWEQDNLHFSSRILGYDLADARKIVQSLIH